MPFVLKFKKRFLKLFIRAVSITFGIIIILLIVPVLILLSPIYLYRFVLSLLVPIFNKDIVRILHTRSTILAPYTWNKPKLGLIASVTHEGEVDLSVVRQVITEKLVEARSKNGVILYPEFKHHLTSISGFWFWKKESNYSIQDHVISYDSIPCDKNTPRKSSYDSNDILQIHKTLVTRSFCKTKSPWEVVVLTGYEGKSIVFWRGDHALGDGFSFAKTFIKLCDESKDLFPTPRFDKKVMRKSHLLKLILFSPFELLYFALSTIDNNAWHRGLNCKMKKKATKAFSSPVPLSKLKEIGKVAQVSLSSVIVSGIAGALRKYYLNQEKKIPDNFHMGTPFPFFGHPDDKLRNHATIGILRVPVGIENRMERLKKQEVNLGRLKNSTVPVVSFLIGSPLLGALFPWFIHKVYTVKGPTLNFTSFPGPKRFQALFGKKITRFSFDSTLPPGNTPLNLTSLTYGGDLHIVATGDELIFPKDENMTSLVRLIESEYEDLYNEICNSV